ncbi:hypothetical protein J5N97_028284 [Dioscorea zingiberensis]|uniref:Katanin p80 subunit C-terminal domain-containing protein n=1 Tax=Dioscorea zingiberensis TaxID=325984 RepID=A0A9D5BZ73_9LILI|nr:hypothetical protein J5N97_028284 [Dioscorea zingiberensis]
MEKMSDHAVSTDVISVLAAKVDIITLDLCTCLLPLLTSLLESKMDRLERCNLCFIELEKVKRFLPSLTRREGSITKTAQELKLAFQEVL